MIQINQDKLTIGVLKTIIRLLVSRDIYLSHSKKIESKVLIDSLKYIGVGHEQSKYFAECVYEDIDGKGNENSEI